MSGAVPKRKSEPEMIDAPAKKKLERLDDLLRNVLSVSNKTVRKKMEQEKRLRQAARKEKRS